MKKKTVCKNARRAHSQKLERKIPIGKREIQFTNGQKVQFTIGKERKVHKKVEIKKFWIPNQNEIPIRKWNRMKWN